MHNCIHLIHCTHFIICTLYFFGLFVPQYEYVIEMKVTPWIISQRQKFTEHNVLPYFLLASCPPIGTSPYEHGSVSVLTAAGDLAAWNSSYRHSIETRIRFGCLHPYQIVSGPTEGFCAALGQWSWDTFPTCAIGKLSSDSCFYKLKYIYLYRLRQI